MSETYIGKSITRHDAFEKVTGQAQFVGDMHISGMLYARLKTSPYAHAKILGVDVSAAEALPGVKAVITGKEATQKVGIYIVDRPIIAGDVIRYYGEAVAAVAADTEETAAKAVELIKVEYEPLPPLQDVRESIKEGAPLVHEKLHEYKWMEGVFFPQKGTNIANNFKIRKGDADEGFKKADVVLENVFYQPQVFHIPLETHTSIVQWGSGDKIRIWSSSQSPFAIRDLFGYAFNLPKTNIQVTTTYVGGGFGCKSGIHLEPLVGLLSKKANGRPVRLVPTREEECSTLPCRQGLLAKIKTGVSSDGKILAEEVEYLWDAGAYADYGVNIGRAGGYAGAGPYEIENSKVDSYTLYTNHIFGTAYRGFGHPEVFWPIERQRDLLAKKLGMDPVEFRYKNLLMPGSRTITGEIVTENHGRVDLCLKKVAEAIGYGKPKTDEELAAEKATGKFRGKACCVLHKAPAIPTWSASSAVVMMNEDGSVRVNTGAVDFGQGTYTVLQQIAAEKLKMPIEKVHIVAETNTDMSPYDWQTVASRATVLAGNAVCEACDDLIDQIFEMGERVLRASKFELALGEECVYVKQAPYNRLPYSKFAIGYTYENGNAVGGPLIGRGKSIAQGLTFLDQETGQGRPTIDWTYGANAAEVEVDTNTGDIRILNFVSCLDIGRVMNEMLLKGQVVGGVLQGIGTALFEHVQYTPDGKLLSRNFVDYKIPTIQDIPDNMQVLTVETPQLDGPFGARGCGEHPLISVTAVIANALANAVGVEMYDLPLTSENVLAAIKAQIK